MCVLSKVLYGTLSSTSYTPQPPSTLSYLTSLFFSPPPLTCPPPVLSTSTPSTQPLVLTPRIGNVHSFKSGSEGAAVLDVIAPTYDDEEGRECGYYESGGGEEGGVVTLRRCGEPDFFRCRVGTIEEG
ncbi:hypothetical protein TrCOL_g3895 [Triparma columacea]|uniref:Uncharacterized protein n=1 Tax=Triparma columacea TaxID=722753 RepID=A0A9W7L2I1_9STRA|nr:hypothetical protein TrCOL_g3895 [Triparma columacea]